MLSCIHDTGRTCTGWAEALGQEYEYINHQNFMAREEMRLLKVNNASRQKEILKLQIELEDLEIEVDDIEVLQMEAVEQQRRADIAREERVAVRNMNRKIRQERSHWRIESNRVNVVRRNRERTQQIIKKVLILKDCDCGFDRPDFLPQNVSLYSQVNALDRGEDYASTIDYEKKAQVWDKESLLIEQMLAADSRRRDKQSKPKTCVSYTLLLIFECELSC